MGFVRDELIDKLSKINDGFEYEKLVRLLQELNSNYANSNYYSCAILNRAIVDHLPPLFGFQTFDVCCKLSVGKI